MTKFVDQNSLSDFIDQNGVVLFRDQNSIFLGLGGVDVGSFTGTLSVTEPKDIATFDANVPLDVILGDRVLDNGLIVLSTEADALWLCEGDPTSNYSTATSLQRATKTGTIFSAPAATANGSAVTSIAIVNGIGVVAGTVTHWAAVDTIASRVLVRGALASGGPTIVGQAFTLPSFTIEVLAHG